MNLWLVGSTATVYNYLTDISFFTYTYSIDLGVYGNDTG